MGRCSKAEFERRVDEVFELLVARVSYRTIVTHATGSWGVGERQVASYLTHARERIMALTETERAEQVAKALAAYEGLYAKQVAAGRHNEARQTMDSIVRLLGLAAPERHALETTTPIKAYLNMDLEAP